MTDSSQRLDRRTFVQGTAAAATVGVLAGCSSDGGNGGGNGNGGGSVVSDEAQERVDGFLGDDESYDGSIADMTGEDEVTVAVGAEGNGGAFAFDPSAVAVSPGTNVVWEWTGEGGQHNVVSDGDSDFDFDSGEPQETGTFEQSFDEAGVGLYVCEPHEGVGMLGAVVVTDE